MTIAIPSGCLFTEASQHCMSCLYKYSVIAMQYTGLPLDVKRDTLQGCDMAKMIPINNRMNIKHEQKHIGFCTVPIYVMYPCTIGICE